MKTELKNKIIAEKDSSASFFENLPKEIQNFTLKKIFAEDEDKFIYFSYENFEIHRGLTAYFHEETQEYKIRVKIGLNEFCLTKFFTANFSDYQEIISAELEKIIENLSENHSVENLLVKEKNFSAWEYGKNLPKNICGFELFVSPQNPVEFTNGSYIIINYSDFDSESDFTICYNVYTENFSAEFTERRVPHVSYLFDSENLTELEKKLEKNLSEEIASIRKDLEVS